MQFAKINFLLKIAVGEEFERVLCKCMIFFFASEKSYFCVVHLMHARIFISFLVALIKTHNFAIYIISCSNFAFCFFVISITFSSFFLLL